MGRGSGKTNTYGGIGQKGEVGQFANFRGAWRKKGGVGFLRGGGARYEQAVFHKIT